MTSLNTELRERHIDCICEQLERASHSHEGREGFKCLINEEILAGFADPDEIAHEHDLEAHFKSRFLTPDGVVNESVIGETEQSTPTDFRDGIEFSENNHKRIVHYRPHWELRSGETYLISVTLAIFELIPWWSKRLGTQHACGCYPVFVKIQELGQAGVKISGVPRKAKGTKVRSNKE